MAPNTFAKPSESIPIFPGRPVGAGLRGRGGRMTAPPFPAVILRLFLSFQKAPQPRVDFVPGPFTGGRLIVTKFSDRLDDFGDGGLDVRQLLFEFISHRP